MRHIPGRKRSFFIAFGTLFTLYAIGALGVVRTLAQCTSTEASGPDAVSVLKNVADSFGCFNGTQAYFVQGGVCNVGTEGLPGILTTNHHPMMVQNLYRLADDRFEQIGQSWVKHDDWTYSFNSESTCGSHTTCTPCESANPPCNAGARWLAVGCQDIYSPCRNGCQTWLGPRSQVNPTTGLWPAAPGSGTETARYCDASGSDGAIACRLQVPKVDLVDHSDKYYVEQQFISLDEESEETRNNNVSYKAVTVGSCINSLCSGQLSACQEGCVPTRSCSTGDACSCPGGGSGVDSLTVVSTSHCQEAAILAWKASETACSGTENCVKETVIQVSGEGRFILAAKAVPSTPTGFWRYEYALYNMNSERGAASFSIPLIEGTCAVVSSNNFHDVDYHSGDGVGCGGGCKCAGGTNNGQSCGDPAQCPGGVCTGTCSGGSSNGQPCDDPAECPGGVCTGGTRLNFDGTNWPATVTEGSVSWATTPFTQKQNANALRWGTLYNFRFRANRAPTVGNATMGLFKSGGPEEPETLVPGGELGPISCDY